MSKAASVIKAGWSLIPEDSELGQFILRWKEAVIADIPAGVLSPRQLDALNDAAILEYFLVRGGAELAAYPKMVNQKKHDYYAGYRTWSQLSRAKLEALKLVGIERKERPVPTVAEVLAAHKDSE